MSPEIPSETPTTPTDIEQIQVQAEVPQSSKKWTVVLFVAIGIIIVVTLVAIFFVIPKYVDGAFGSRVNSDIDMLNTKNNNSGSQINCNEDVYNCGNFTTQAEAQVVYDACFPVSEDIHQLDGDANGKACEMLT